MAKELDTVIRDSRLLSSRCSKATSWDYSARIAFDSPHNETSYLAYTSLRNSLPSPFSSSLPHLNMSDKENVNGRSGLGDFFSVKYHRSKKKSR